MHNACIVCPKTTTGRISSRFLSRSAAKAEWESTQKRECFNASTDTTSNWSRITENSGTWKNQTLCPWNSACEVVWGRLGGLRTNSKQKNKSPFRAWVYWHNLKKVQCPPVKVTFPPAATAKRSREGSSADWQSQPQRLCSWLSPTALTLPWL